MSLVSGEDSESDEELNTEQLGAGMLSRPGGLGGSPGVRIISGEDEEEEQDGAGNTSKDSTAAGKDSEDGLDLDMSTTPKKWEPPTILHRKLGEANYSLRRNIVTRLIQLYQNTSRNLTTVNDSLTKAQHIIEKVNANVKKSDQDLVNLKTNFDMVFDASKTLAPGLNIAVVTEGRATPSSSLVTETP